MAAGVIWGNELSSYGIVGGQAKMFWTVPDGRWQVLPFVAATLDQDFAFSHTIALPGAGEAKIGSAQTFLGGQIGVDILDKSGITFGINGFYQDSAQYEVYGGKVYVKLPLLAWAGLNK